MKKIEVREFGSPEVLRLIDAPDLEVSDDQVLIRVRAVGVNPVETYIRSGQYPKLPAVPFTPGNDAAGTAEKVGANVTSVKPGDRVYVAGSLTGTYAEFCLCDARQVFPLPENISFEQGAGIFTVYATAFRALFQKARAQAGEFVLIHGATGGVGIAAVQLARGAKMKIIGTGGSADGRNLVMDNGADFTLDHTAENYLDEIMKITDGRGVDAVVEMLANVNLQNDFDVLAMFGRIVVVGNRGSLDFNPRAAMSKDATIYGMSLFNAPSNEIAEIHAEIGRGLSDGTLHPIVGKTFPLAEAAAAHRAVMENDSFGKIVLIS